METQTAGKVKIRACECCGTSVTETEPAKVAGSEVDSGTIEQSSRTVTETKQVAGTCDCGCETSGCDCGCECCKP